MITDQLDAIKARIAAAKAADDGKYGSHPCDSYDIRANIVDDIEWLVAELEAARKVIEYVKLDGHSASMSGPEYTCLTCDALADYDADRPWATDRD